MGPTKCFRVSHLSAALAAVLLLAHVQRAWGSCQKPITPQEGLTCDTADVDSLKSASPDIWWTFTTPPEKYAHARTHTHTRTLAHSHTRTLAHSHTRTHAHAHTLTHTHTRTLLHTYRYVPGIDYIKNYYQCCRHCMWSFEYPAGAPIVAIVTDELDCVRFQRDFARYNTQETGRGVPHLTPSEMQQYLREESQRQASRADQGTCRCHQRGN